MSNKQEIVDEPTHFENNKWSVFDIPDLSGKIVIVTGANSGTGYEVSKALSSKGANVVMACRNIEKAESAAIKIRKEHPDISLIVSQLDLSDLSSINTFSKEFQKNTRH